MLLSTTVTMKSGYCTRKNHKVYYVWKICKRSRRSAKYSPGYSRYISCEIYSYLVKSVMKVSKTFGYSSPTSDSGLDCSFFFFSVFDFARYFLFSIVARRSPNSLQRCHCPCPRRTRTRCPAARSGS